MWSSQEVQATQKVTLIVRVFVYCSYLAYSYNQYIHHKMHVNEYDFPVPEIIGVLIVITYLLTPWIRVLLETLIGFKLVKKFLTFHGTRKFITAFTSARHLSLS